MNGDSAEKPVHVWEGGLVSRSLPQHANMSAPRRVVSGEVTNDAGRERTQG